MNDKSFRREKIQTMNLDDAQKQKVAAWIAEGLTLSQIQGKLASDLGISMTYMEVRFLIDDLKLKPKDKAPPAAVPTVQSAGASAPAAGGKSVGPAAASRPPATPEPPLAGGGAVTVSVDHLARPGALVSGKVTFSDGNSAEWYLDQTGRLGLVPAQQGYRPPPQDVQAFQMQLQEELQKLGF
jgi:hypothetical protein